MPRDIYTCVRERRWAQIPWVPEKASGEKKQVHVGVIGGFKHPGVHEAGTQLRLSLIHISEPTRPEPI
eukprot:3263415-Pyramimonas_sp.AAC.1